jgi:hypothetical protein
MLVNRDFKRLGDLAAGTVVVYREGAHRAALIPPAAPLAPPAPLSLGEQRTLLDLAERSPVLSPARVEELAELARPLIGESRGDPAEHVLRVANHLVGRSTALTPSPSPGGRGGMFGGNRPDGHLPGA